jgi:hypothetical protein
MDYSKRLCFGGKKIDFWATLRPDKELSKKYDEARSKATEALNERVAGGKKEKQPTISIAQRNTDKLVAEKGAAIRKFMDESGEKCSIRSVASQFNLSEQSAARVVSAIGKGV